MERILHGWTQASDEKDRSYYYSEGERVFIEFTTLDGNRCEHELESFVEGFTAYEFLKETYDKVYNRYSNKDNFYWDEEKHKEKLKELGLATK